VVLPDLRGHGLSRGPRAHIRSLDEYQRDLVRGAGGFESPPWIVFGHSMGGLLALRLAATIPQRFLCAVAVAPFLAPAFPVPRWKNLLGRAAAVLLPRLRISTGLGPEVLCRDPEVLARLERDELFLSFVTARMGAALLDGARETLEDGMGCEIPTLVVHGSADRVAAPEAIRSFCERCGATRIEFDGLYHEVLNEPERGQVLDEIERWLDGRLSGERSGTSEG
jgi:alpha-beta hydrolase superfamily lysophospholipase